MCAAPPFSAATQSNALSGRLPKLSCCALIDTQAESTSSLLVSSSPSASLSTSVVLPAAMSSVNDTDLSDSISWIETDASSDFELVDFEDDPRLHAPSSTHSQAPSIVSDEPSAPPSPALHESHFHFPDPAAIFRDANLESSSLCTIVPPPEPLILPPPVQQQEPFDPAPHPAHHTQSDIEALPCLEKLASHQAQDPFLAHSNQRHAALHYLKRAALDSPKATCILMLLATVLLGFPFQPLSALRDWRSSLIQSQPCHLDYAGKGAAPAAPIPTSSFGCPQAPHCSLNSLLAAPSTSLPASLSIVNPKRNKFVALPSRQSTALQPSAATPKSLTLVSRPFTDPSVKTNPKTPRRKRPDPSRASRAPYIPIDAPVLPYLPNSSSLGDAATMSWDYWLGELSSYYHVILRPAIVTASEQAVHAARQVRRYHEQTVLPALHKQAARTAHHTADRASKAARLAHRYHNQQLLPALTALQKRAVRTTHRTAELAARYNQDQLRPAIAFVHQQTLHTARRSAEYQRTVVTPAVMQLGSQSLEAAKTTSDGLNKAAKRFSIEAAKTVEHVKHVTHVDLEALGVDLYVGFLKSTWNSFMNDVCAQHQSTTPCHCTTRRAQLSI